ncbi:hypothetical protein AKJ08_0949 [Vulgatibacter incomptus]|uniref:Outer membrane beta-barrel domain-containing protein n=1 Tax=Vulgatibacter incomptus TaxID=1391653 RepID=A0A0K1PAN2_9BACT|nr:hypothetical protein AKJ08_0949 [Vulgatibacter incomptus]
MNRSLLSLLTALLAVAVVAPDLARADDVVEKVVVRNRKHRVMDALELSPSVGFSVTNRLTSQTNFQLGIAYNFSETFALEARGGYALGGLTSVGDDARASRKTNPFTTNEKLVDEFQDLWRLQWQALLMPRWTPIYGKINLATELPIHFQAYLTAGGGAVGLTQDSVLYCQQSLSGSEESAKTGFADVCPGFANETRADWAIAGGGGFRFFVTDSVLLRMEIFDIAYPDTYRKGIDRGRAAREVMGAAPQEGTVTSAGLTNVLFFNLGASVVF